MMEARIYGYYWQIDEYNHGEFWGFTSKEDAIKHAEKTVGKRYWDGKVYEHILDNNKPLDIYTGE